MIERSLLFKTLSSCCEMDSFHISLCSETEQEVLRSFLPECKSVIVLAHHIKSSIEWLWFPLESERGGVTCAADLHLQLECNKIIHFLENKSFKTAMPPYPKKCGLRFKDMADKTGLGSIGDNFLFLHREWGPWTHLRVILTDAEIMDHLPPSRNVCIHCGACQSKCPSGAITKDTLLGLDCDAYQDTRDNEIGMQDNYVFKCEVCVRACPIGKAPLNFKEIF